MNDSDDYIFANVLYNRPTENYVTIEIVLAWQKKVNKKGRTYYERNERKKIESFRFTYKELWDKHYPQIRNIYVKGYLYIYHYDNTRVVSLELYSGCLDEWCECIFRKDRCDLNHIHTQIYNWENGLKIFGTNLLESSKQILICGNASN